MGKIDLNEYGQQVDPTALIPDGTIVTLQLALRPNKTGGMLHRSQSGESYHLDAEMTVADPGPYFKRKLWGLWTVQGESEGHQKAVEITFQLLRGIVESAHGIKPTDKSQAAVQQRVISDDWHEIDGLRFIAKVGIERGGTNKETGQVYRDKNRLLVAVTPDAKDWHKPDQAELFARDTASTFDAPRQTPVEQQQGRQVPSWAR